MQKENTEIEKESLKSKDLDLFCIEQSKEEWLQIVDDFKKQMNDMNYFTRSSKSKLNVYNVKVNFSQNKDLEKWIHFQFIWIGEAFLPWTILHIFDIDCCQIGFDGEQLLCTPAFLEAIKTQTIINYKTNMYCNRFSQRLRKYNQRNFSILLPINFYRDETRKNQIEKKKEAKKIIHLCYKENGNSIDDLYVYGLQLNQDYFNIRKMFVDIFKNYI